MMQPTYFVVYEGIVAALGTQDLFEHQRPTAKIQIQAMHHLSAKGLHPVDKTQSEIDIPTPHTDFNVEKGQDGFFVCLNSGELVAVFDNSSI
jgi:hypothetical protein